MKPSLSHARPLWLRSARWELLLFGVFALLLLGIGIVTAVSKTKTKDPPA